MPKTEFPASACCICNEMIPKGSERCPNSKCQHPINHDTDTGHCHPLEKGWKCDGCSEIHDMNLLVCQMDQKTIRPSPESEDGIVFFPAHLRRWHCEACKGWSIVRSYENLCENPYCKSPKDEKSEPVRLERCRLGLQVWSCNKKGCGIPRNSWYMSTCSRKEVPRSSDGEQNWPVPKGHPRLLEMGRDGRNKKPSPQYIVEQRWRCDFPGCVLWVPLHQRKCSIEHENKTGLQEADVTVTREVRTLRMPIKEPLIKTTKSKKTELSNHSSTPKSSTVHRVIFCDENKGTIIIENPEQTEPLSKTPEQSGQLQ